MNNFYVFEGGEGSGKTTAIETIATRLRNDGYQVLITREPGGVDVAEEIRSVIMNNHLLDKTEVLLFAAARVEHLKKVSNALEQGQIVLCDRYIYSSLVYQGIGRRVGVKEVADINLWATDNFLPNKVFFLDIEPQQALQRISNNKNRDVNRFDLESLQFHQMIYAGYKEVFKLYDNIINIDANRKQDDIADEIYKYISGDL